MTCATLEEMIAVGNALQHKGLLDEAIAAFRKAIEIKPDLVEAHFNLGNSLRQKGLLPDAIAAYRKAVDLKPDFPNAYNNLAVALHESGQLDEAVAVLEKTLRIKPDLPDAYVALGNILRDMGRIDEAIGAYDKALAIRPDDAGTHVNKALMLLLKGDFAGGWPEYEWRWEWSGAVSPMREFRQPLLADFDPAGRTILLHAEQGVGDTLQFVRYAPLLARRGARIILGCPPELKSLMRGVEGVQQLLLAGQPLPWYHLDLALLSLPLCFGTTLETIPAETPYLQADERLIAAWRERLAHDENRLKVGLVWAGNPARPGDRLRSVSLSLLAPLAKVKDVTFYSLQKGPPSAQAKNPPPGMNLVDFTEELHDFGDTAALIANLDLVITVDTAVAHLAGAMAKPTWVLLEFVPAWRWMLHHEDSPWYPTMRLFRQSTRGDWRGVVEKVVRELTLGRP